MTPSRPPRADAEAENKPPTPPSSSQTTTPMRNAIKDFFTPRRRTPATNRKALGDVSATNVAVNSNALSTSITPAAAAFSINGPNKRPFSPDESPSTRGAKKARGAFFIGATEDLLEEGLESPTKEKRLTGKRLFTSEDKTFVLADKTSVKVKPNQKYRMLMRELGTGIVTGTRTVRPHHCAGVYLQMKHI